MKRIIFVIFGILTAIYGYSQSAATVNIVRTDPILIADFREAVTRIEQSGRIHLTESQRREVLEGLINQIVLSQAADRDRLVTRATEDNLIRQYVRNLFEMQRGRQPSEDEYRVFVLSYNLDSPKNREQMLREIKSNEFLRRNIQMPSEDDITDMYNRSRGELRRAQTFEISIIVFPYGSDSETRQRSRTSGDSIVREINNSASKFEEIFTRSTLTDLGYYPGKGFIARNQPVRTPAEQALLDAVVRLNRGQVSRLIEGPEGFYIVKVDEIYPEKEVLSLEDPRQLGQQGTVRDFIIQYIVNLRQQALLGEERRKATITYFEDNINRIQW